MRNTNKYILWTLGEGSKRKNKLDVIYRGSKKFIFEG